jgi:hypothetical protein
MKLKKKLQDPAQWHAPVIPGMWEAQLGGQKSEADPRQKHKNLSETLLKAKK